MKKAIVTLKDGRAFEFESEYLWGYEEKLNDNRTPFIGIEDFIFRKDEISTIETINLPEVKKEEE